MSASGELVPIGGGLALAALILWARLWLVRGQRVKRRQHELEAAMRDFLAAIENRGQPRRVMGDQPFSHAELVVDAAARLQLLDPGAELEAAVERCLDYVVEQGVIRSLETLDKWPEMRKELVAAIAPTRARVSERSVT